MPPTDDSIASTIIHDVRGRFTALRPYVELLEEESIGPLNEQQRECVAVIARNVDRLFDGVTGVLEVLRDDLDRLPLDVRKIPVGELLSKAAVALRDRGREEITVELEGGLPSVLVDPDRVIRMLATFAARSAVTGRSSTALRAGTCPARSDRVCLLLDLAECPAECGSAGDVEQELPQDAGLTLAARLLRRQGGGLWATADGRGVCLALPAVSAAVAVQEE